MLLIDVSQIPPEGIDLEGPLDPPAVHVEGEESFTLEPGGRLAAHVDKGDESSVHVRGRLSATVRLQCGRCLEPFPIEVAQEIDLFYLPERREKSRPARAGGKRSPRRREQEPEEEDVELGDRDMVVAYYSGDHLDLGEAVREQLFLGLPLRRVCSEACRGLCPTCGVNRNTGTCDCPPEEQGGGRLAVLKGLFDKGSS